MLFDPDSDGDLRAAVAPGDGDYRPPESGDCGGETSGVMRCCWEAGDSAPGTESW